MAVGPSAAPIMPIDAASFKSNPSMAFGQKRAEVNHSANANKKKDGERFGSFDAYMEKPLDDAACFPCPVQHLVEDSGRGKIDEDSAEPHRKEQGRLVSFFDSKPYKQDADKIHGYLLPCDRNNSFVNKFHKFPP